MTRPVGYTTKRQLYYLRHDALQARINALPAYARTLVKKYRKSLEIKGRREGDSFKYVERFLDDIQAAFDAQAEELARG